MMGFTSETTHGSGAGDGRDDRWLVRGLLLAAVLLAAPLAGCAASDQGGQTDGEASGVGDGDGGGGAAAVSGQPFVAERPLDTAFAEAESWQADAELVGVAAIESNGQASTAGDGDAWGPATTDNTIPDGEAGAWAYHFFGENSWYTVVVHMDGTVDTNETDDSHGLTASFTGWGISSSEAAKIAMNHSDFAEVADDENAVVQYTLQSQGDGPFWRIRAHSPSADSSPGVEVDATSGDSYQYAN